jgi:hypothetical protein
MLRKSVLAVAIAIAALSASAQAAEKVQIGAMHMCCPICEKTIYDVLKKAGISKTAAKVDRAGNECRFTAKDRAQAEEAIMALVKDGYWGNVKINSDNYTIPVKALKIEGKYDEVVFDSVHLCCNACGVSIGNVVEIGQPKGLEEDGQDYNRANKTATFKGKGMDPAELLQLLHNAGFHGEFNATKSKKAE